MVKTRTNDEQDKVITTIYIRRDLRDFLKENKISLSEEINRDLADKYLGITARIREIENNLRTTEDIQLRNESLKQQIQQIKARRTEVMSKLTTRELQYIGQVAAKRQRGYDVVAMKNYFNVEFKRAFTLDEFVAVIDTNEKKVIERMVVAIKKSKEKRK